MAHKNHPDCPYTSMAACERARREALGRCVAMMGDKQPEPCANWATDQIDGHGYCGQHINSAAIQSDKRLREQRRRAVISERIEAHILWVQEHPSVWDART